MTESCAEIFFTFLRRIRGGAERKDFPNGVDMNFRYFHSHTQLHPRFR